MKGRVARAMPPWFETALTLLLTMRVVVVWVC